MESSLEADALEEMIGEAVDVRKKLRAGSLRVHAKEVFVVNGLLRCLGPVKNPTFGLRRNFEENREEGRSSAGQGGSWIRYRHHCH